MAEPAVAPQRGRCRCSHPQINHDTGAGLCLSPACGCRYYRDSSDRFVEEDTGANRTDDAADREVRR